MSINTMKTALEAYLKANLTTVAIKWKNTSYYELNGTALNQAQIDALTIFVEPKVLVIGQDRELMSSATPFAYEVFFQIDIYAKDNTGMGGTFALADNLDTLFREQTISGINCLRTFTINSFDSGNWIVTPYRALCVLRA